MSDTKEYIKGDKHVHQAGSIMIKFAQYNVPEQKGGWKQQEEKEAEELEKGFADFEEVVDETAENNESKVKVKPDLPPADVFVNRVKAIVLEMAKKNGETIPAKPRGQAAEYVFFVDGQRLAKMMDDLRKNHENKINEFISRHFKSNKYDGVMTVAPFIGGLLDLEEIKARGLQLTDLEFAFKPFYSSASSAVRRLSAKLESDEAKVLYGLLIGFQKRHKRTDPT
jgi:hypothetical protein